MRRNVVISVVAIISYVWTMLCVPQALAACRNPNVAEGDEPLLKPAAASGVVEIKWFGHAFFQITSSAGTRIITDPFGNMGYPMPEVWAHVVTVGRDIGNHNNTGLAKGNPVVLWGLKPGALDWSEVNTTFRDVLIYNVPIQQRHPSPRDRDLHPKSPLARGYVDLAPARSGWLHSKRDCADR